MDKFHQMHQLDETRFGYCWKNHRIQLLRDCPQSLEGFKMTSFINSGGFLMSEPSDVLHELVASGKVVQALAEPGSTSKISGQARDLRPRTPCKPMERGLEEASKYPNRWNEKRTFDSKKHTNTQIARNGG